MTDHHFHDSHGSPADYPYRAPWGPGLGDDLEPLSVPYAGQTRMRLTIASGLSEARIRVDPEAKDLIAIDCGDGNPPRLRVSASELRVSWPWPTTFGSWLRAALTGQYRDIEVVLHPTVEWTLLIRGGLSQFEADLVAGRLARLDISANIRSPDADLECLSALGASGHSVELHAKKQFAQREQERVTPADAEFGKVFPGRAGRAAFQQHQRLRRYWLCPRSLPDGQ